MMSERVWDTCDNVEDKKKIVYGTCGDWRLIYFINYMRYILYVVYFITITSAILILKVNVYYYTR